MRKQYFYWSILVLGIVGSVYGAYSLIYHTNHGNGFFVPGLILLLIGAVALLIYLWALVYSYILRKKNKVIQEESKVDEPVKIEEPTKQEEKQVVKEKIDKHQEQVQERKTYNSSRTKSDSYKPYVERYPSTLYVKQVGYGPVLRVTGPQVLDMRNNTYYRIENNIVNQDGYGIRFEINGNHIRDAFGGYLYEVSGGNINKVFGGFYASISGNYITLHDGSVKYETTESLSKKQLLVVAALLF